jgi:hypothetical protein
MWSTNSVTFISAHNADDVLELRDAVKREAQYYVVGGRM